MCFVAASWFGSIVQAQPNEVVPEFDVASVKANHSGSDKGAMQMSTGSLTIVNAPLTRIVGAAFGISEERIAYLLAGPDWMGVERYDVNAKFPASTSADQVRLLLQALLKQRFGMRFHREMREVPAYALVVAKSGLKALSGGGRKRERIQQRAGTSGKQRGNDRGTGRQVVAAVGPARSG
jgi:uncharacterized protein (TIGR03435 family)